MIMEQNQDKLIDSQDSASEIGKLLYGPQLIRKMNSISRLFVRRGRDVLNEMIEPLHDLEESGTITEDELVNLLTADLLWHRVTDIDRATSCVC